MTTPQLPAAGQWSRDKADAPRSAAQPNAGGRTFRLARHFSIASLLGIVVVLVVLLLFYRYFAFSALTEHETRGNVALTRVFANTLWPDHAAYVGRASSIPPAALAQRPEIVTLRRDVLEQMRGLNVVKVKIYNLDGLTVFSTDPRQIGEDKRSNAGFLSAKAGRTESEITFRNRFDAFEQVINDRNLGRSVISCSVCRAQTELPYCPSRSLLRSWDPAISMTRSGLCTRGDGGSIERVWASSPPKISNGAPGASGTTIASCITRHARPSRPPSRR